jgi:hypothetical protein
MLQVLICLYDIFNNQLKWFEMNIMTIKYSKTFSK